MPKTQVKSPQIEDGGVRRVDLNTATAGSAVLAKIIAGGGISLSSTGADSGTGDATISLADIAAMSVLGRASSLGTPTAITGTDGQVLRVSGTTLGFGAIAAAAMPALTGDVTTVAGNVATTIANTAVTTTKILNSAVTYAKIQNLLGLSVFGRSVSAGGVGADITATATSGAVLRESGSTIGFGTIVAAGIASDAVTTVKILNANVTYAKIQNVAGLSVIGNATNGSLAPADITGADTQVLRVSGTTLGFGTIVPASAAFTSNRLLGRSTGSAGVGEEITVGAGLRLFGGVLSLAIRDHTSPPVNRPSGATLDLSTTTSADGPIEVTGTTNISAITLADGEERTLVFTNAAGLTITQGASLKNPGGVDLAVVRNDRVIIRAEAGVITITDRQTATDYSTQTFDNIYMNPGANIGFANLSSPYFDIGRDITALTGSFLRFTSAGDPQFYKHDLSAGAALDVSALTGTRFFQFPDHDGTFATQAGTESLTNKKLGSLTTNGIVRTSGGDGTLSVDTTVYGSGTVTNFSAGDLSPLFTTSEATTTTTPALTFSLSTAAANTFFGNGTGSTAAPTFMDAATARVALGGVVIGPASSTDGFIAAFDGTTGKLLKDTGFSYDSLGTPDTFVVRDSLGGIAVNDISAAVIYSINTASFVEVTAATGTPITLVAGNGGIQVVTGTSTNTTFNLPVASTLGTGHPFWFRNEQTGTGTVIVKSSGGGTAITIAPGCSALFICKNPGGGTTTLSWTWIYFGTAVTTAKKLTATHSLTLTGTDGTTQTFPSTSCTVARTDAAQTGSLLSSSPTGGGIGYATGAGGAVTQATNRTTGVTINKLTGTITTSTASLAALTAATFTVTNSTVAIGDVVVIGVQSGATNVTTDIRVTATTSGTFNLTVHNLDAITAEVGAILINFAVIKAVAA